MAKKIEVVLFDVGNVLLRLKTQKFLEGLTAACPALSAQKMLDELRHEGPHHAYERGEISGEQFHGHLQNVYGLAWDYPQWLRHWNDYFLPNRPMEVFIAKLQGQVKFWGLSNTNAEHYTHFKREYRIFDSFVSVIGSHQLGLRKPDPKIYTAALKQIALAPESILFIDDLPANVEAARKSGMQAFCYTFNDLELKAFSRQLGIDFPDWESRPSVLAC